MSLISPIHILTQHTQHTQQVREIVHSELEKIASWLIQISSLLMLRNLIVISLLPRQNRQTLDLAFTISN